MYLLNSGRTTANEEEYLADALSTRIKLARYEIPHGRYGGIDKVIDGISNEQVTPRLETEVNRLAREISDRIQISLVEKHGNSLMITAKINGKLKEINI